MFNIFNFFDKEKSIKRAVKNDYLSRKYIKFYTLYELIEAICRHIVYANAFKGSINLIKCVAIASERS